jgi:hypothetical protein
MDYTRYGIADNPYKSSLVPVGDIASFEPIHPIDSMALERSLSSAVSNGNLASYAITGTSGSGRTAVARYIMSVYGRTFEQQLPQLRAQGLVNGPARKRYVANYEHPDDGNVAGRQVARNVLKGLLGEVRALGGDLKDGAVRAARDEINALKEDSYSIEDLQPIATDFADEVFSAGAIFTCSVENVPNVDVFRSVRRMFAKSKGLLTCTIVAEKCEAILGTLKPDEIGDQIILGNLGEANICRLAQGRWEKSQATPPLPFKPPGLENAFRDNQRTVGKTLETLAYMISAKLTAYRGPGLHPVDEGLSFEEDEIRDHIKLFDRRLK